MPFAVLSKRAGFLLASGRVCRSIQAMARRNSAGMSDSVYGDLLERARAVVPRLETNLHKGQAGRIGIVGGSVEYTGAPYFAGISALRVGADLVHVFCCQSAAMVIKSYSPDLIVHPVLDDHCAMEKMEKWLDRLHVLVVGPGLGREHAVLENVAALLKHCRHSGIKVILDADALHLLTLDFSLARDLSGAILTPNAVEYRRLFGETKSLNDLREIIGKEVTVLEKGLSDKIYDVTLTNQVYYVPPGGSARRCGGQGDLLSGALATFYCWALNCKQETNPALVACFAASILTKHCNEEAFREKGRGTLCCDMIEQIPKIFRKHFEHF
ncbi:ATP-dependent (S)-NAD(P)H-hydrate dehydratase [Phlebotomus papatasi]|uniref:ATP-dependent (S)-NAD(P)H-hydrate dehydratase n=1 Tax=Phlebotomus papatasi TaxID=29031 RepID=UPI00248433DC|nr:ATP-dependent (S)-NAD(P)H-hydrate dehydratase [Phlebotomus papatasi]